MSAAPPGAELEQFRTLVGVHLGLHFEDSQLSLLDELLRRRARARGVGCGPFLALLGGGVREEWAALAQELTIPESHFFRDPPHFRVLVERVLPERALAHSRPLRILSAGCASGEEPYSIAIAVRETLDPARTVSIRAVDVNRAVLTKGSRGCFTSWSLRDTPLAVQQRWFRARDGELALDPGVRAAVCFEERNLLDDDAELWAPELYDVVFCRNALMYFTPTAARAVVARIARALAPGGYLFLGHAENLRGISDAFELCHRYGTFYYRRGSQLVASEARRAAAPRVPGRAGPLSRRRDPPRMLAIADASKHVDALAKGALARSIPARGPLPAPAHASSDLELAVELMRAERFAEALERIRRLPPELADEPDVLLIQAVLLVQNGELLRAAPLCRHLLERGEHHSGAHYVLALCREAGADARGAAAHDQIAVELDPAFAMPRLHLGLLARREGNRDAAGRELARALVLLEREDASRLLLFGGGFSREALIDLCRSELRACGERA